MVGLNKTGLRNYLNYTYNKRSLKNQMAVDNTEFDIYGGKIKTVKGIKGKLKKYGYDFNQI